VWCRRVKLPRKHASLSAEAEAPAAVGMPCKTWSHNWIQYWCWSRAYFTVISNDCFQRVVIVTWHCFICNNIFYSSLACYVPNVVKRSIWDQCKKKYMHVLRTDRPTDDLTFGKISNGHNASQNIVDIISREVYKDFHKIYISDSVWDWDQRFTFWG